MKNLLYKEFKLAWHPLCYVFIAIFNLFILIPNYPAFIGPMFVPMIYTLLFIGANKGKQTNDLYYTVTLPVKKSNIVISRFISMAIIQFSSLLITGALAPASQLIRNAIGLKHDIGFGLNYVGVVIAFALIAYIIVDAVFLLMFYRKGRSVIAPSIVGMVAIAVIMSVFTLALPLAIPAFKTFFENKIWIQFVAIVIALVVYAITHIFILKQAIKEIKKINF